jgi:hypothetical protein
MADRIPPPHVPMVDKNGKVSREWYNYFAGTNRTIEAGEVQAGAGLAGGGFIQEGVELRIGSNGVTNAMLRDSLACSVIGRFQNSTGDPADIQASADGRFLQRDGAQLVFRIPKVPSYTVAAATAALAADLGAGTLVYVSNESGGAVLAFSDGVAFRRVTDRAIVS